MSHLRDLLAVCFEQSPEHCPQFVPDVACPAFREHVSAADYLHTAR